MKNNTLAAIYEECVKLWAPPEDLTVDEWADKYRILDSGMSAEAGQWRTDRTPYMREPMRAFTDSRVEEITVVAPSQVGKSELELNILAFIIDQDPGTVLYVHPAKTDGEAFSKLRIGPMSKACPRLRDKLLDVQKRGRTASSTILQKSFPGGMLRIVGSNNPSDLSSSPIRYLIGDELDRFAFSAGRDGDPWELAKRRQNTFYNRKRVAVSTPTIKGASQIEFLYLRGTQERWKTRCPHCLKYNEIKFDDIRFDPEKTVIANKEIWKVNLQGWRCPSCLEVIPEQEAKKSPSRWEPDNPDAIHTNRARSFWLTGFASPWRSWENIIQIFLESKDNPERFKVWKNTDLGELWEERSVNIEEHELIARAKEHAKEYPDNADLPDRVLVLTMAVDCQKYYMQYEIVGWSHMFESWGIRTGTIKGSPDNPKTWEELDSIITRAYKYRDGRAIRISLTFIDSGDGKFTNEIAEKCRVREHWRVYAVKGSSTFDKPFLNPPRYIPVAGDINRKYWLYLIGVSSGKSAIYISLQKREPGPNFMYFPYDESRGYNLDFYSQLLSETLVKDGATLKWKTLPGKERNEALDIRNYNRAAIMVLNPNFDAIERALKKASSEPGEPKQKKGRKKRISKKDEFSD